MIFKIPLAFWFGILTIISLFITASLGLAVHRYHKPVFKYHKIFAFLTISLAIIHAVLVLLLLFFGISI